jgi:transcriptional regulator with XRE-family HTH domain
MNEPNVTRHEDLLAEWSKDPEYVKAEFRVKPYYVVAKDVFDFRVEMDLTQEQLAERATTFQSRISRLESGELDFKLSTLIEVAEALDAHVDICLVKNIIEPDDTYQALLSQEISSPTAPSAPRIQARLLKPMSIAGY